MDYEFTNWEYLNTAASAIESDLKAKSLAITELIKEARKARSRKDRKGWEGCIHAAESIAFSIAAKERSDVNP